MAKGKWKELMREFDDEIPVIDANAEAKKIQEKINNPKDVKKQLASKKIDVKDKLLMIEAEVKRILGSYSSNTMIIKTEEELVKYIDKAIENKVIAIDTETNNSLNTFDCQIMGLCLYTPGLKAAYVPVNHVDVNTREKLSWQVTEEQIGKQLHRILENDVYEIYHNAVFDIEVLMTTCGVQLKADWDTMVGAQLIDENELKGLKYQYRTHIDPSQEKYDIEHLFQKLEYAIVDPDLFALYAATDSYITYELYKWQVKELSKPENAEVLNLMKTIEIPVLEAIVAMEMTGVEIDLDYATKMSTIYHAKSDAVQAEIDAEMVNINKAIAEWRKTSDATFKPMKKSNSVKIKSITYKYLPGEDAYWIEESTGRRLSDAEVESLNLFGKSAGKSKNEQLPDEIDFGSPTQMAILLYDILKAPVVNKSKPRTTDSAALEILAKDKHIKICELLLKKRDVDILINTFIDKLPEFAQKDGRVHPRFNSTGTLTGRFSCSNPNMQQIPSHDKLIRMMFKPQKGYAIVGGDYSGQEPRSLCAFSQDKDMQKAYQEKKDLYAIIASKCFHNNYEDNLEFHPETGAKQPEGKKRRSKAKTVFLGTTYGMGAKTLSERMELPLEESQQIIDDFFKGFPGVDKFAKDSQEMARKNGFVTDIFGRKRHLPDAALPEYEFSYINDNSSKFNPILGISRHINKVPAEIISNYTKRLEEATWRSDRDKIYAEAKQNNIDIKNNSSTIARAQRQTLNSRIQGSAASMTKLAMTKIIHDEELNRLGFKLQITVHDEVFGECPIENAEAVGKRLCEVMVEAAKVKCEFTPWSVDPYVVSDGWYEDEVIAEFLDDYNKQVAGGKDKNEALKNVQDKYTMCNPDAISMICNETYEIGRDSIKYGPNYFNN